MTDRHLRAIPDDDTNPAMPHDDDAERQALGAMLTGDRWALDAVTNILTGADYYQPRHELIHDACVHLYARGTTPEPTAVITRLRDTKNLARAGGPAYIHEIYQGLVTAANADYHADSVHALATRRRALTALDAAKARLLTPSDDHSPHLLDRLRADLDGIPLRPPGVEDEQQRPGQTIDDFLAGEDDPYDWLIPDLLERTDRLIVTAGEGVGKSTLLRQIGIQSAAGIHPVTGHPFTPVRVLLLDLENSQRQSRRKLRPMRLAAGDRLDPANFVIECRIQGLNLKDRADITWLDRLIEDHKPDLLITGPIYKMADGDPNDEQDSKPVVYALDALRAKHGLTIILEAHTKKAEGADQRKRAKDPVGWSGWRRWPEFGLHLSDDGALTHWRGARDERTWPHQLNRGGAWPFTPEINLEAQRIASIKEFIRINGNGQSERAIADATHIPRSTVQRLLKTHASEFLTASHWSEIDAQDDTEGAR